MIAHLGLDDLKRAAGLEDKAKAIGKLAPPDGSHVPSHLICCLAEPARTSILPRCMPEGNGNNLTPNLDRLPGGFAELKPAE